MSRPLPTREGLAPPGPRADRHDGPGEPIPEETLHEWELGRAADEGMTEAPGPELEEPPVDLPGPGTDVPGPEDEPSGPGLDGPGVRAPGTELPDPYHPRRPAV